MKNKFIFLTGIVVAILVAGFFYNKYRVAPKVNFKSIELETFDNEKVLLSSYESKKIFICFFATWCGPCIKELPSIKRAQRILADEDILFILVSDEEKSVIEKFWNRTDKTIPVFHSVKKLHELKIETIPTSYLLNENREIIFKHTGEEDWASEAMLEKLKESE